MAAHTNPAYRQFRSDFQMVLSLIGDLRTVAEETVHDVRKALKKGLSDLRLLRQGEEICVQADVIRVGHRMILFGR